MPARTVPGDDSRAKRAARAVAGTSQRKPCYCREHGGRYPAGRRAAPKDQPFDGQTGVAQKPNVPLQFKAQSLQHRPNDMARAMRQLQA